MLYKLPRHLPPLANMLDDLQAAPMDIARALDVSRATVYRWREHGQGPRCAALALYWMTTWGQDELHTELHNRAQVQQGLAESLQRHVRMLEDEVRRLSQLGHYGSANDPSQRYAARFGLDGAATIEAMRPHVPRMDLDAVQTAQVYKARR